MLQISTDQSLSAFNPKHLQGKIDKGETEENTVSLLSV